jgi:isoleucyl-tRNA synthetase
MLQNLIRKVSNSYETFAFYEVYHAIYRFCITDMSSFYLDILKDKLYTFRADSPERRGSQIVLYNVVTALTKMITPILSFTAEELWSHIPGDREESVFLSAFPEVNEALVDEELEKKWQGLKNIRDEVNKALEVKRQEKLIGNALEASVTLYAAGETYNQLAEYTDFLPELFIVSSVDLMKDAGAPASAYRSEEISDLLIAIDKAEGGKCQRCWNWRTSVGTYGDHPELCTKCHTVMTG